MNSPACPWNSTLGAENPAEGTLIGYCLLDNQHWTMWPDSHLQWLAVSCIRVHRGLWINFATHTLQYQPDQHQWLRGTSLRWAQMWPKQIKELYLVLSHLAIQLIPYLEVHGLHSYVACYVVSGCRSTCLFTIRGWCGVHSANAKLWTDLHKCVMETHKMTLEGGTEKTTCNRNSTGYGSGGSSNTLTIRMEVFLTK